MSSPIRLNASTARLLYGYVRNLAFCLLVSVLTACATNPYSSSVPEASQTNTTAGAAAKTSKHPGLSIARDMVGTPYRYGGASPRGFDCSGLVFYSYRKAGFEVPRNSYEQYRQSQRVQLDNLKPGDLVFFSLSNSKPSHVGIYEGNGRFVHAPSSGKHVSYASLSNPYWRSRVIGAGRFQ